MKPYFFGMTITSKRPGEPIGKRCGVVFADSEDAALETAWDKFGSDTDCKPWVEEVPEDGMSFTVYKSQI